MRNMGTFTKYRKISYDLRTAKRAEHWNIRKNIMHIPQMLVMGSSVGQLNRKVYIELVWLYKPLVKTLNCFSDYRIISPEKLEVVLRQARTCSDFFWMCETFKKLMKNWRINNHRNCKKNHILQIIRTTNNLICVCETLQFFPLKLWRTDNADFYEIWSLERSTLDFF